MKSARREHKAYRTALAGAAVVALVMLSQVAPTHAATRGEFLYPLSDFGGTIPYNWVGLFSDPSRNEVYVTDVSQREVRIFNEKGMKLFSFGAETEFGAVMDGAIHPSGDIFLLSRDRSEISIFRCNFRGEPQERITLQGLPKAYESIRPERIAFAKGRLYLADRQSMRVVLAAEDGTFKRGVDLASRLDLEEQERGESGIAGFHVDAEGTIYFTVQAMFSAYKLYANGRLLGFGEPGSTPGKFGVVGGIVSGASGNTFVADILRCVVMIFDEKLKFQSEFGYRGPMPSNLVAPMNMAFDKDKVFVAQRGGRGVSVFRIYREEEL